jgi:threonine 3-dehydrogenase
MKALVKAKPEVGIWLEDVPEPVCGMGEVKIRVHYTGICGTDIHIYNWDDWAQKTIKTPMVAGHEFVGEVIEVGASVTRIKVGDMVSAEGHIVCGRCRSCLAGQRHLCPNTIGVGVNRDGAFAEYIVIPQENAWLCDPAIPLELYGIFDPFGNAVHTACSFDVRGEDVLITGAGPIGAMAASVVRHSGARHVVVTDVNDYRLELARTMGATHTVNVAKEKLSDVVRNIGMREGFDVGLEMSGNPSAFSSMLEEMRAGGKIALLGILPSGTGIDWDKVVFKGLQLKGIYGREMFETWHRMTTLIHSGIDISPIITHRLSWKDYQEGFEIMRAGKSGKIILDWTK